jgi:predicted metal-binding protein
MEIIQVQKPVTEALILVCEKCGKKMAGGTDENPARNLQLAMKEHIKTTGKKGELRAVLTSCLDVCPKDEITVAVLATSSHTHTTFLTIKGNVEKKAEEVLEKALEIARHHK